jgi:fructokinase
LSATAPSAAEPAQVEGRSRLGQPRSGGVRLTSVLGIGELLWDLLPAGPRLGGAPFNVVVHLRRLAVDAAFLSAVGDDELGARALAETRSLGVPTDWIRVTPEAPTGTAGVEIDREGRPSFAIHEPAAYGHLDPGAVERVAKSGFRPDAIVFGTLAQRFPTVRQATRDALVTWPSAARVYDVNLRDGGWTPELVVDVLRDVSVLKLNDGEVGMLAAVLDLPADPDEFARALADRYGIGLVCVTAGAEGATAWDRDGRRTSIAGLRVAVADTVGAGDAFTAGLVASVLQGGSLADSLRLATAVGALVASRPGATAPWTRAELDAMLAGAPGDSR